MLTERVEEYWKGQGEARQPVNRIGAWNVGTCIRKLWLQLHGAPQEATQSRSMRVFETGYRVEDAAIASLEKAGITLIRTDEKRDTVDLPPVGRVRSDFHFEVPDPVGNVPPAVDSEFAPSAPTTVSPGELVVCDVKSMSDYGFDDALHRKVSIEYEAQLECYMRAYDLQHALLYLVQKSTDHICELLLTRSDQRWEWIKKQVQFANGPAAPARPFQLDAACPGAKTGKCINGKTPARGQDHADCGGTGRIPGGPFIPNFPCGYCPVKTPCWGTLEVAIYKDKPRFRVVQQLKEAA